ncbi:hypothetical protein ACFVH6_25505 [Spirillospora sp. NPDC127200]
MTVLDMTPQTNDPTLPFGLLRQITLPESMANKVEGAEYDYDLGLHIIDGNPIDPIRLETHTTTWGTGPAKNDNASDAESV